MERYVCIHGHFYQPPRENPWLETIELQETAAPYHDWNERITDECYRPNTRSRILDEKGRVADIVNNYARMSINFGPTVLSWLEAAAPDVHAAILDADRESARRFGGHGSAMAQAYNHPILPLCNDRDRETVVLWGVRDFERRFGRKPEGMWMPETAVNTATLETLAAHGIRFTVMAPRQAGRSRPLDGSADWSGEPGRIDPSRAYLVQLPSGREINVFFYDGPISQAVAFERLLDSGEAFANRLLSGFDGARKGAQLVHIATDGESYGHHHRHGDMALAYALDHIERTGRAKITNYAQFLDLHPPTHAAEIVENSSWSCIHGVERWRADCGCNSGRAGWHQKWRAPLRAALDWLRDTLAPAFEREGGKLLKDPWAARDDYIAVILDRAPENADAFLGRHARGRLSPEQRVTALRLLEMQRHLILMYTSCGWFFDDLTGIETVQVLQYAARAIDLAQKVAEVNPEPEFVERLREAPTNIPATPNGSDVYFRHARSAMVDLERFGAHYAASSLFENYGERTSLYCVDAERLEYRQLSAGRARFQAGHVRLTSQITGSSGELTFGVLHLGDHLIYGGVRRYRGPETYGRFVAEAEAAFNTADFAALLRLLDTSVGMSHFSLKSLFKDEQRKVVDLVLERTLADIVAVYRQTYETHAPMLRFLGGLKIPPPRAMLVAGDFVVNAGLRAAIGADPADIERIHVLIEEARVQQLRLDDAALGLEMEAAFNRLAASLAESPHDADRLRAARALAELGMAPPFSADPDELQHVVFALRSSTRPPYESAAAHGDEAAAEWLEEFDALAHATRVRV